MKTLGDMMRDNLEELRNPQLPKTLGNWVCGRDQNGAYLEHGPTGYWLRGYHVADDASTLKTMLALASKTFLGAEDLGNAVRGVVILRRCHAVDASTPSSCKVVT